MKSHLCSAPIVGLLVLANALLAVTSAAQQTPPAPVPVQITAAKKIFIANAGVEGDYFAPDFYAGGPNRAYDELYAAVRGWGRYDLIATPGDADLIFEIRQVNRAIGGYPTEFALRIIDPKTHITLWSLTRYVQVAALTKTRERNYEAAMTTLVNDLRIVATPAPSAAGEK